MPPKNLFLPLQLRYPGARLASVGYELIFVILLYLPSCFGQETDSKGTFWSSSQAATSCLPQTVESSRCPFLLLNAKQEIESRFNISGTDARSLIGANIFFFIQQNLRYLIGTTTLLIGHTLCFFVRKVKKNSRFIDQKDNTTYRDA